MPVLGITGGIATGKSTFVRAFLGRLPARLFDADACARDLLENDSEVRERLHETFGLNRPNVEPGAERAWLREVVFSDAAKRRQLEAILHPVIRERWVVQARECAVAGGWFCVDIPLLFETGAESYFDRIIVVACSGERQRARLREDRGLDESMSEKIIASQLDLGLKITKADHLIWNDSTISNLEGQTALLATYLSARYG
ncbi:MAG: coaE [Chthoniobacteraceae bacterium]|nr:coaE [Chthoniobacteraceae bacterium]